MLGQDWALSRLPIQPHLQAGAPLIEYPSLGNRKVMLMVKNKQVKMYNSI